MKATLANILKACEGRGIPAGLARLALRLCNGPEFREGEVEREKARIVTGVLGVLS